MKKFLKKNMKVVLAFIFGSIITGSIVYATVINSIDVAYDNSNSTLEATTVQGAIDELYNKAQVSEKCPDGYTCYKTCEYQCSNGFYATYTNGIMTSCRYSGKFGSAVCNGGNAGVSSLYMCQESTSNDGTLYSLCNRSLVSVLVYGGGCPSTYTCP